MTSTLKVANLAVLALAGLSLCLACGSAEEKSASPPSKEDLAVEACKRILLERYASRLDDRRFPPREQVSVADDGASWEVMFTTRPKGSEFPILAVGCVGVREAGGEWSADEVSIYD